MCNAAIRRSGTIVPNAGRFVPNYGFITKIVNSNDTKTHDITRICITLPNSGKPSIPYQPCALIPYTFFKTLQKQKQGESIIPVPLERNINDQSSDLFTLRQSDFSRQLIVNSSQNAGESSFYSIGLWTAIGP